MNIDENNNNYEKLVPAKILSLNKIALFYLSLIVIAGIAKTLHPFSTKLFIIYRLHVDVVVGIAIGLAIVAISTIISFKTKLFKELTDLITNYLGHFGVPELFFISFVSAFSEEIFFRGMIQDLIGYPLASLAFGLMHTGPNKRFIPWTIFAVIMGFLLGGAKILCGSLVVPIIIHFVVNFGNMLMMDKAK